MIKIGDRVRVRPNYTLRFTNSVGTVEGITGEGLVRVIFDDYEIPMLFAPRELVKEGEEIVEEFCMQCGSAIDEFNDEVCCSVCFKPICENCADYCPICRKPICEWCELEVDGTFMCELCAGEYLEDED